MPKFLHYKQTESKDCGHTYIKIIAKYYKKVIAIQHIRSLSETTRVGSTLLGISDATNAKGLI